MGQRFVRRAWLIDDLLHTRERVLVDDRLVFRPGDAWHNIQQYDSPRGSIRIKPIDKTPIVMLDWWDGWWEANWRDPTWVWCYGIKYPAPWWPYNRQAMREAEMRRALSRRRHKEAGRSHR